MPIKYLNRNNNSTAISAGNSVLFNGSSQYLTIANSSAVQLNTGNFTIEGWIYATAFPGSSAGNDLAVVCDKDGIQGSAYSSYSIRCTNSGGAIKLRVYCNTSSGGGFTGAVTSTTTINTGTWYHFAYVRNGATAYLYINGTQEASTGIVDFYTTTNPVYISYENNAASKFYWPGYISNFRIVKGTAVYTTSFTPSTSPLTAITNTSLLTCNAATIVDASSNNFTITNNGAATVSSTVPFTASFVSAPNGIKFRNRNNSGIPVPTGNSVQFNGSNQCLTVPSNAAFNFGTGDFTLEAWVYWTSTATSVGGQRIFLQGVAGTTEIGINYNATKFDIDINNLTRFSYTYAISTGQWYHIALVRRSTNVYELFVNGTSQGTNTYTYSQNANNFIIGGLTWASNYGTNGYISNVRILKGTALYTASFTAPTSPLTAIANTSLLTCNSATIVDNSSNNLTITNNNSATVSSTTPFTVATAASAVKMKKVYSDPVTYMIATGGDLVTTSGSYKIHKFTTVGTSSFTISSIGNTSGVEYLVVGGGGGGGGITNGGTGGGGGGQVIYNTGSIISVGIHSIIIGDGGVGGPIDNYGGNGQPSYLSTYASAIGGGGGASKNANGLAGANGGGGGENGSGGGSTVGGFSGASGGGASSYNGGGGGGAGANGSGRNGGSGVVNSILGASVYYGGGGAGGEFSGISSGGLGGGGNNNNTGSANTGGGGSGTQRGGVPSAGFKGGSGIVIIKYRYAD